MSHEFTMVTPGGEQLRLIVDQQAQCPPPGAEPAHLTTPEQVRAVDAAFTEHSKESDQVLGLIGLWTSALVLHDVAVETFDPPAGELEEEAGGDDEDDDDNPHLPGY
jgi:hypothetical protein